MVFEVASMRVSHHFLVVLTLVADYFCRFSTGSSLYAFALLTITVTVSISIDTTTFLAHNRLTNHYLLSRPLGEELRYEGESSLVKSDLIGDACYWLSVWSCYTNEQPC